MEESKVVENKSSAKKKSPVIKRFVKAIGDFFSGVKAEFGKIIWPTKDDIIKQTTAVVIVSIICCALIAVLDYAFEYGMNFITSIF